MKQSQSITTLAESPDDDRRRRLIHYMITMTIRIVCIVLCLFVTGWWLILPILGAVVLPYIAVLLANATNRSDSVAPQRPGALVPVPTDRSRGAEG